MNSYLPTRIRQARLRSRLSQQKLAELAGTFAQHVSKVESGRGQALQVQTVEKLADAMGHTVMLIPNDQVGYITRYLSRNKRHV